MTAFSANLRTLCQFPKWWGVWLLIGIAASIGPILLMAADTPDFYIVLFIPLVVIGITVGRLQRHIANIPLTFSLPGHQKSTQRLALTVGLSTSIVFALPWAYGATSTGFEAIPVVVAATTVGVGLFYAALYLALRGVTHLMWWFVFIVSALFPNAALAIINSLEHLIFTASSMVVLISVATVAWAIPLVLSDTWYRTICGQFIQSPFQKQRRSRQTYVHPHLPDARIEEETDEWDDNEVDLDDELIQPATNEHWMGRQTLTPHAINPYSRTVLCLAFLPIFVASLFPAFLGIVIVMCCCVDLRAANIVLLVPAGRRERFRKVVTTCLTRVPILTGYVALLILISATLHAPLSNWNESYTVLPWWFIGIPLCGVPLIAIVLLDEQLTRTRRWVPAGIKSIYVGVIPIVTITMIGIDIAPIIVIAFAALTLWALFFSVAAYRCFRCDLGVR